MYILVRAPFTHVLHANEVKCITWLQFSELVRIGKKFGAFKWNIYLHLLLYARIRKAHALHISLFINKIVDQTPLRRGLQIFLTRVLSIASRTAFVSCMPALLANQNAASHLYQSGRLSVCHTPRWPNANSTHTAVRHTGICTHHTAWVTRLYSCSSLF